MTKNSDNIQTSSTNLGVEQPLLSTDQNQNEPQPQLQWPTQKEDMEAASFIIKKYTEMSEGEPLGFIELIVYKGKKKKMELKTPEWIVELQNYFRSLYGYELGHNVTSKVLTKFLLRHETIH